MKIPVFNKNKVKISEISLPEAPITLFQFCEQNFLTVEIRERDYDIWKNNYRLKFYATFNFLVEESDGYFLTGISGDGYTPKCALKDLAKDLSNKKLRINSCFAPKYIYTNKIVVE